MRVIAGKAKSLPLKTLEGDQTRPTTDRIKETLFNLLQPELPGCRFLDLFAGSGAIGIEALSRGASRAVFVEKNPRAVSIIRENLRFTHLEKEAEVLKMDAAASLAFLSRACPAQEFAKCLSWAYSFILPICLYLRPCSSICHCPASLFMVLFPFRVSLPSIPLHALPLLPGCCILQ